jgi:transcriptional regulator with XRE-family HTH domain
MRRMMLAMSQEKLGDALGLTFQQVQKYEKGTNRISASRLQQCADILQVMPAFFFEGTPNASTSPPTVAGALPTPDYITEFTSSRDGLALARDFTQIHDAKLKRSIVAFVEELVDY